MTVPQAGDFIQQEGDKPCQRRSAHGKALGEGNVARSQYPPHRRRENIRQNDLQDKQQQRSRKAHPQDAGKLLHQNPHEGGLPQAPQVHIQYTGDPTGQHQQVDEHRRRQHPVQDIPPGGEIGSDLPVQVGGPGGKGVAVDHGIDHGDQTAAEGADEQLDAHRAAQHRQRTLAGALNARTAGQPQQKEEYRNEQKAAQSADDIIKGAQKFQTGDLLWERAYPHYNGGM